MTNQYTHWIKGPVLIFVLACLLLPKLNHCLLNFKIIQTNASLIIQTETLIQKTLLDHHRSQLKKKTIQQTLAYIDHYISTTETPIKKIHLTHGQDAIHATITFMSFYHLNRENL